MADPYLVPCLAVLRAEFNALNPTRDKGADGWIGDAAHQSTTSDHNPRPDGRVLALDIDASGPWPTPFDGLVKGIIARERARWLDPNDVCRLEYVIWNRKIYSRSRDFAAADYTGTADPHTGHAHFSSRHDLAGSTSTAPWGVEVDVELTADQIDQIATAVARKVWAYPLEDPTSTETPRATKPASSYQRWPDVLHIGTRKVVTDARDEILAALDEQGGDPA